MFSDCSVNEDKLDFVGKMNIDHILKTMNDAGVKYLVVGGVNFLLRHQPVLTFDIDLWILDSKQNRAKCQKALALLGAEWGADLELWAPVRNLKGDWLAGQSVYCLTSRYGSIDIFRHVNGLADWRKSLRSSVKVKTTGGVIFRGISDGDMLKCQMSLDESQRKLDRIRYLRNIIGKD